MNRVTWLLDFGMTDEDAQLVDNLKTYARIEGITQKRMFLLGLASYLEQRGNGQELIEQIADYLVKPKGNNG